MIQTKIAKLPVEYVTVTTLISNSWKVLIFFLYITIMHYLRAIFLHQFLAYVTHGCGYSRVAGSDAVLQLTTGLVGPDGLD